MEEEEVVIAGAGVAGVALSLGLHRLGIRSLVLESSESLRVTGFGFGMWSNAWKALEALGVAAAVREQHTNIESLLFISRTTGRDLSEIRLDSVPGNRAVEVRGVQRKKLLEALASELPRDTIRFSSRVVGVDDDGPCKSLLLADGTTIRTKVLIGADGVNSVVAKYLGLKKPVSSGRFAIRGFSKYEKGHGFDPKMSMLLGDGVRYGVIPSDDHSIYWFCTFRPSSQDEKEMGHDPAKMKEFVLNNLGTVTENIRQVFENADPNSFICSELKFRYPWELLWGNIYKHNVCVIGDALHPMTPDIAQGACCALEDSVVLARCLGKALKEKEGVQAGLKKFAKERRWRSFEIISLAYITGRTHDGGGAVLNYLRDKFLAKLLMATAFIKTGYDCGNLTSSS